MQPGGRGTLLACASHYAERLSRSQQLQINHHKAITLAVAHAALPSPRPLADPPGLPSAGIWCACGPPRDSGLRVIPAHWCSVTVTGTEGGCGCPANAFFKVCEQEELPFSPQCQCGQKRIQEPGRSPQQFSVYVVHFLMHCCCEGDEEGIAPILRA
jgi:hypothetical protein